MKTVWKPFFFKYSLIKQIYEKVNLNLTKKVLFLSYNNFFLFDFCLNLIFHIYSGKNIIEIKIYEKMLGFKIKNYLKLKNKYILKK